jgi:hypothetical protein
MIPRSRRGSTTRRRILVDHCIHVVTELLELDRRSVSEGCDRGLCGDEPARSQWLQFADGNTVARDDESLAAIQRTHDVAAAIAELSLGDLACHRSIVAPVLRAAGLRRHLCPPFAGAEAAVRPAAAS